MQEANKVVPTATSSALAVSQPVSAISIVINRTQNEVEVTSSPSNASTPAPVPLSSVVPNSAQPLYIKSAMSLLDWRGSITTFKGFTGTRPVLELNNATWHDIVKVVAPVEPITLDDKSHGLFFVPCLLKETLLVGNTLEYATNNGQPTTGKMRSKRHVTEAAMLVIDVDGLTDTDFKAGLAKITSDGLTVLFYTTYSYGSVEKPNIRARLVIPLDRPLGTEEYASAWYGFDQRYWQGQTGQADASGANLYQQQGTWCCHPDRFDDAKKKEILKGVASADALIALGRIAKSTCVTKAVSQIPIGPQSHRRSNCEVNLCKDKKMLLLRTLLGYIDPDSTHDDWVHVGMALHYESAGEECGYVLFDDWSRGGNKYKNVKETKAKWRSFRSRSGAGYTIATLFWMVKKIGVSREMIYAEAEPFEICGGDQNAA